MTYPRGISKPIGGFLVLALLTSAGCASRSRPPAGLPSGVLQVREGLATYYGKEFDGKKTASGARFDANALVAAHPTYPFGTIVRVTNLGNGRLTSGSSIAARPLALVRLAS